jgi:hypothetical protein
MSKTRKRLKPTKHNLTVKQLEACVVKLYLQTKVQQAKGEEVSAIINDLNRANARAVELEMFVTSLLHLLPDEVEQSITAKPVIVRIHPDAVNTFKSKWAGYIAQYHG